MVRKIAGVPNQKYEMVPRLATKISNTISKKLQNFKKNQWTSKN